jgi:lipopolysaccharide transport system permease protein
VKRGFVREFVGILMELIDYRELLFQLTLRDIRIRYKQAVMGFGWAVFMPMLIVLSGMVVRFAIVYLRGDELQTGALGGIAVKALPWAFFVGAIGFANASLIGNSNLVTKIYFPREVLPLSAVVAQAFDTLVGATALVLLLPFLGAKLSVALLWLPLLALILFLFTAALALFLSCANLFFRDVKYLVQTILLFGIFFTPVFFEPAMLGPTGAQLMMLNPLGPILEGTRLAVIEGHNLLVPVAQLAEDGSRIAVWTPWYLAYSTGWATLGFGSAALLFHHLEFLFAEYA